MNICILRIKRQSSTTAMKLDFEKRLLKSTHKTAQASLLTFTILLFASSISAKDYKVELIVFENLNGSAASESHAYQAPEKMKTGSSAWFIEPSMLIEEAEKIEESSEYLLKQHYSWGIESLPYEDSANYNVVETDSQGYIKVYADQLLFTNIDIDYKGFRLKENRRLKLNEKHFFDHPKFGLLMQVSRLEKPEESDLETPLE